MNRFDYVLFDLDGTLLDTREGVLSSIIYTIKKYNLIIPDQASLESMIGPPIQESFKKLYGISDLEAFEMAAVFRETYMKDEYLFQAIPYDGIYDLFDGLVTAGIKIGIATYKREDYAKRLLCEKGFGKYTNFMYGSDFAGILKKSHIIRKCLIDLRCTDLSKSVYIGDGSSDGRSANEVGMNFIGVTYGFGFKAVADIAAYGPFAVANNCHDLSKILYSTRACLKIAF